MSSTRSVLITAFGIWMALAAEVTAQYTLPKPEQNHRSMGLSSADHAAAHSTYMAKLQARLDTALQRSYLLEQRIQERLTANPQGGKHAAVALQMTQNVGVITVALHSLAEELGRLMADEPAVRDRSMQNQMEEIQLAVGDIAAESQKIMAVLEKMTRMAPPRTQ